MNKNILTTLILFISFITFSQESNSDEHVDLFNIKRTYIHNILVEDLYLDYNKDFSFNIKRESVLFC